MNTKVKRCNLLRNIRKQKLPVQKKYWTLKLCSSFFRSKIEYLLKMGRIQENIKEKSIQQQITHLEAEGMQRTIFFHMFFSPFLLSAFCSLMSFDIIKTGVKGSIQMYRDQSFVAWICNWESKLEFLEEEELFSCSCK